MLFFPIRVSCRHHKESSLLFQTWEVFRLPTFAVQRLHNAPLWNVGPSPGYPIVWSKSKRDPKRACDERNEQAHKVHLFSQNGSLCCCSNWRNKKGMLQSLNRQKKTRTVAAHTWRRLLSNESIQATRAKSKPQVTEEDPLRQSRHLQGGDIH